MKPPFHVQDVIDSVIASGVLGASEQQLTLLQYLIEQSLDDHAGKVNEYTIALDAFRLSTDFDSARNSTVRVELHRLRKNLKIYNAGNAKYQIKLPPRSYVVDIAETNVHSSSIMESSNISKSRKMILSATVVLGVILSYLTYSYFSLSSNPECSANRPILIIDDLLAQDGIRANHIFYKEGHNRQLKRYLDQYKSLLKIPSTELCSRPSHPVYRLNISPSTLDESIHLDVEHLESGSIIYAQILGDITELSTFKTNSAVVAFRIGDAESVVMKHAMQMDWANQKDFAQHECVYIAHEFYAGGGDSALQSSLDCLTSHYQSGDFIWEVPAYLSLLYLGQLRNDFVKSIDDPLKELLDTHQSAARLSPFSAEVLAMDVRIKSFLKQDINRAEGREAIRTALEIQPYNPRLLHQMNTILGFFYAEWEIAMEIQNRMISINGNQLEAWYWIDVMNSLMTEDPQNAFDRISLINFDGQSWGYLIQWILAKRVDSNRISHYRNLLTNQGFDSSDKLIRFVTDGGYHSSITDNMLRGICAPKTHDYQRCAPR